MAVKGRNDGKSGVGVNLPSGERRKMLPLRQELTHLWDSMVNRVDDSVGLQDFSEGRTYAAGNGVMYGGQVYRSLVTVTPGPWNAARWELVGGSDAPPFNMDVELWWWNRNNYDGKESDIRPSGHLDLNWETEVQPEYTVNVIAHVKLNRGSYWNDVTIEVTGSDEWSDIAIQHAVLDSGRSATSFGAIITPGTVGVHTLTVTATGGGHTVSRTATLVVEAGEYYYPPDPIGDPVGPIVKP